MSLMNTFRSFAMNMWNGAMKQNKENIESLLKDEGASGSSLLDLGCDDGNWTRKLADTAGADDVYGIDIVAGRLELAAEKGIKSVCANLNDALPFRNDSFDIIHANQVIEHVADLDMFISEIYRVLRPGGHVVLSTENGSSWCNIFAGAMGWQTFSSTNISSKGVGIGNPLALHRNTNLEYASWSHKTIFNYRGLQEFLELYDFQDVELVGAGYFPLPGALGRLDPRHSHFLAIRGRK